MGHFTFTMSSGFHCLSKNACVGPLHFRRSLENDRAVFEVNEGQTVDHVRVGGEDDGVIALMGGKRRYLAMETLLHPLPEEAAA